MDIKTGDEVRITLPRHHRHGASSPEGGYVGRVVKTGRKYATAEYEVTYTDYSGKPRSDTKSLEFSMETGAERDSSSSFRARVQTPEQAKAKVRQDKAREVLFKAGISVSGDWSRLTLEQWETLAAVAATLPEYDRSHL
jgi:hypothetical protein